jgi:predicted Zn-dependent peptidase
MYLPYAITGENMSVVAQQLILGEVTPEEAVELVEQNAQVWREQNPEYVENFKKWIEE